VERNRLAAAALSPNVLHPRRKNFTQKNSGGFRVTEERVGGYISGKNLSSQRQLVPVTSTCPGNVNLSRSRQLVPVTSAAPRNPSASQDTEHLSFCQTVLEKEAAYRATVRWSWAAATSGMLSHRGCFWVQRQLSLWWICVSFTPLNFEGRWASSSRGSVAPLLA